MNRKGLLLAEETLKIVIAVICLGVLLYFLGSLYLNSQKGKDVGLAEATLENIVQDIENGKENSLVFNPEGWVVVSWSSESLSSPVCEDRGWKNCLCICDDAFTNEGVAKKCSEKNTGICVQPSKKVLVEDNPFGQKLIRIDDVPLIINFEYKGDQVVLTEK